MSGHLHLNQGSWKNLKLLYLYQENAIYLVNLICLQAKNVNIKAAAKNYQI